MLPKYKGSIYDTQRWSTFGSTCLNLRCKLSNTLCSNTVKQANTQDAFVTLSRWAFFLFFTFFRHLLVVFGGLQGLEASVDADQNLDVTDPSVLFDLYLNTCPGQGSRTIRTEVRACCDIDWTTKHSASGHISLCTSTCFMSTACQRSGINMFQQEAILVSMSGLRPKIAAAFSSESSGLLKS